MCGEIKIVRWARPSTKASAESGWRPAIVKPGRKWLSMVYFNGHGVAVAKIPIEEQKFFKPLTYRGNPYPLKRAAWAFKRLGKGRLTKEARAILREVLDG